MKYASCVGKDGLISFGVCFGKFTKTTKFRLHITALDFLAPYAKVIIFRTVVLKFPKPNQRTDPGQSESCIISNVWQALLGALLTAYNFPKDNHTVWVQVVDMALAIQTHRS